MAVAALVVAAVVAAALTAALRLAPALAGLDHAAADYRTAVLADRIAGQHPQIVLVTVTDEALSRHAGHAYRSPTDRGVLARLLAFIDRAKPAGVGLDYLFDRPTEKAKDDALIAQIRRATVPVVLGVADSRAGLSDAQRTYQDTFLAGAGAIAGHLSLTYDRDAVVRYVSRAQRGSTYPASFAERLARIARAKANPNAPPLPEVLNDSMHRERIAWLRSRSDASMSVFRTVPAIALLDAAREPDGPVATALRAALADKIVLIGGDFPDLDLHLTPLRVAGDERMTGLEIHAHMLAQLIDGRRITHTPLTAEPLLTAGLALVGFLYGYLIGIGRLAYPLGVGLLILADLAVFSGLRTILPFTMALTAWLAGAWAGRNIDRLSRGWLTRKAATSKAA